MRARTAIIVAIFSLSESMIAQRQEKNHLLLGFDILTPYTKGRVDGPKTVIEGTPGVNAVNSSNVFSSHTMVGASAGLRIDQLNATLVVVYHAWVEVGQPDGQEGSELEFQARYALWQYGPANLSGIISVKRGVYAQRGGMFSSAYEFSNPIWFAGIGIGANFSVLHGEVQLRGWPRTIIAYAHEPNGLPPNSYGQASYDLKPVYLNYAISLALGLEFDVISF